MTDQLIHFSSAPTYADYAEANKVLQSRRRSRWTNWAINAGLVVIGIVGLTLHEAAVVGSAVGALIGSQLYELVGVPLMGRRKWSRHASLLEAGYEGAADPDRGLNFRVGGTDGTISWDGLIRFVETDRQFVLFLIERRRGFIMIPKRDLAIDVADRLRATLKGHVLETPAPRTLLQRARSRLSPGKALV